MNVKTTPWKTDTISMPTALAAAKIRINSISPIHREALRVYSKDDPKKTEDNYGFLNVAVDFEFQWKEDGRYTWAKIIEGYTIYLPEDDNSLWEEGDLFIGDDLLPIQLLKLHDLHLQIYMDVIRFRAELEDPKDSGNYTYYLDAKGQ